jgi:hypothetical protein
MASVTVTGDIGIGIHLAAEVVTGEVGPPIAVTVYGSSVGTQIGVSGSVTVVQSVTVTGDIAIEVGVSATVSSRQQVAMTGDIGCEIGLASTVSVGRTITGNVGIGTGLQSEVYVAYAVDSYLEPITPDAFVLNIENFARSEYSNYALDSMIQVDGKQYGCDANGLYLLEGSDDDGTDIVQVFQTGLYDNGISNKKNAPNLWLACECLGKVQIRPIHDYEDMGDPLFIEGEEGTAETKRVQLPLGPLSRYWGFEIRTIDNSILNIDNIEYDLDVSTRS